MTLEKQTQTSNSGCTSGPTSLLPKERAIVLHVSFQTCEDGANSKSVLATAFSLTFSLQGPGSVNHMGRSSGQENISRHTGTNLYFSKSKPHFVCYSEKLPRNQQ